MLIFSFSYNCFLKCYIRLVAKWGWSIEYEEEGLKDYRPGVVGALRQQHNFKTRGLSTGLRGLSQSGIRKQTRQDRKCVS